MSRAVRKGSVWRDQDGEIKVYAARKVIWPTASRMVLFGNLEETTIDCLHESDFRAKFEWVRGKQAEQKEKDQKAVPDVPTGSGATDE
jgi:hypothetical protein